MKKLFFASAFVAAAFITGCNSASSGNPKTVLIAFFEALGKKDMAAAKKLATKESESMFSIMEMGMKMGGDKEMDKFDKSKMEFGEAKIEGDKATVPVKDIKSGESTNFILKKESGDWKVAFDKASMMQMGADKMKEKGVDDDKIKEGMDELNKMNTDSLEKIMKGLDTTKN